jgi:hypothetical protein
MTKIVKKLHYAADFLNKPFHHSDATILSSVKVEKWSKNSIPEMEAELRLRDCSCSVSIAVDADSVADYQNSLAKIRLMIKHLNKLEKAYVKGWKIYRKMRAEAIQKEKERKAERKAAKSKKAN